MSNLSSTREVRDWALARGINVPRTGGLSRALGEAYNRAHPEKPYPIRTTPSYAITPEMRERAIYSNRQRSMA